MSIGWWHNEVPRLMQLIWFYPVSFLAITLFAFRFIARIRHWRRFRVKTLQFSNFWRGCHRCSLLCAIVCSLLPFVTQCNSFKLWEYCSPFTSKRKIIYKILAIWSTLAVLFLFLIRVVRRILQNSLKSVDLYKYQEMYWTNSWYICWCKYENIPKHWIPTDFQFIVGF